MNMSPASHTRAEVEECPRGWSLLNQAMFRWMTSQMTLLKENYPGIILTDMQRISKVTKLNILTASSQTGEKYFAISTYQIK